MTRGCLLAAALAAVLALSGCKAALCLNDRIHGTSTFNGMCHGNR